MSNHSRDMIVARARKLSHDLLLLEAVNSELVELALGRLRDVELAVVWLSFPLAELGHRSPVGAWNDGDGAEVEQLLREDPLQCRPSIWGG